jgi:dinuclear metal center YbgI/SA1388 family protein
MIDNKTLTTYCQDYLKVKDFNDYCPNGLQIEGKKNIQKIITGVSANQALIDAAIDEKADCLLVHHGFFWKGENACITGIKKNRITALLQNNVNLLAYHLPLDAHPIIGNNAQLAQLFNIKNPRPIGKTLVWQGELNLSTEVLTAQIEQVLTRKPWVFGKPNTLIKKIAWCSGGAQDYLKYAIDVGAECFITGEISEQTPAVTLEQNMVFISAGHHATERYGVQALGKHLADKFTLDCQFIDINNPV